ncbi:MAG: chorismate synthase [Fidelibacterota bacterium]
MQFLTAGESHGKGLLGIIEGIPAGLDINEKIIADQLARRQMGYGRGNRMKIEKDYAEIYCGVRHGKSLGSPIGLILPNKDWDNWKKIMQTESATDSGKTVTLPRPGHADLAGVQKFGFTDIRNVLERSSARETAMRVALSAICRKLLDSFNIHIASRVTRINHITDITDYKPEMSLGVLNEIADKSSVRCFDPKAGKEMVEAIDLAKKHGDSVGGEIQVLASGLPYGLGTYTHWDGKLHARIAGALLSVNAFKSIEFGPAIEYSKKLGSETHDEIEWDGMHYTRKTNHAGGIEGGMTNAQILDIRVTMKPIPTLIKPLKSVDIVTKESKSAHKERTDTCAVPAASIVAEAMLAIVLTDALMEKFGGDSMDQLALHIRNTGKY